MQEEDTPVVVVQVVWFIFKERKCLLETILSLLVAVALLVLEEVLEVLALIAQHLERLLEEVEPVVVPMALALIVTMMEVLVRGQVIDIVLEA